MSVSTAMRGSLQLCATLMTSWSLMNSQSPSEAMTMRASCVGSMVRVKNSGTEITPAVCATVSPSDRLMARPGTSMSPSHTRAGPSMPSSYLTAKTRPPAPSMRSCSGPRSGLWSMLIASASSFPLDCRIPIEMRLSPTLATVSVLPRMIPMTSVVPLNSQSMLGSLSMRLSQTSSVSVTAASMFVANSAWEKRAAGMCALRCRDTRSPFSPCPSITMSTRDCVSGSSAMTRESWFFLRGL
mmetsp:Transcript_4021/g.11732  ORF Transcript_4021/g.11732 Transcript_4021/m.11732 type:complete len:241 (+) Transcript_4021:745-1467(+)